MSNRMTTILILSLIIISIGIGIYFYPSLPNMLASHWNSEGMVDGFMPKFWGTFLMPIVLIIIYAMYIFIPKIDPLKENLNKFKKQFNLLIFFITLFLFYIFALTITWNIGIEFNMNNFIIPATGIFIFYIGWMLKFAKRNWFVGIRNPWTLSSEHVWDKTHKIGSSLFKLAGILILLTLLFPSYGVTVLIISLVTIVLFLFVYSYIIFTKEKNRNYQLNNKE